MINLEEKGLRYNHGKLQWGLLDYKSLEPMVRVLMFGANKYAKDNWKKGMDTREILECMMRHMTKLLDGEENDPESGLPHTGHILCNAMFYNFNKCKELKEEDENNSTLYFLEQKVNPKKLNKKEIKNDY